MFDIKTLYFRIREPIRLNPNVSKAIYLVQSLRYSNFGEFNSRVRAARRLCTPGKGVALCCRIRDEARFLAEFIEYYLAAGIDHFFFYEKLSQDNFEEVLQPYVNRGLATVSADWPHIPVSPSAEQDCILNCMGRFEWIGFIDADEFVVIRDGRSIGDFLSDFRGYPAVALHWRMYGSNGHKSRPSGPVILEYTCREQLPNRHVKCFVRPDCTANYRNSHSWFYAGMRRAANESKQPVDGSTSQPPTAERAWINHYHHKSEVDYFEKAARKSVLDMAGINFQNRTLGRHIESEEKSNAVSDSSAVTYYLARCRALSRPAVLVPENVSALAACEEM
jgi:hypothetical protein